MAPKLFLIGGETKGQYENSVAVLDLNTNKWSQRPAMTWSKGYFGGAVADNKIYICGGCNLQRETVSLGMEAFNLSTNSWETLEKMPRRMDSMGVAALDGYIYVSGGRDETEEATSEVYRYCIETNRWDEVKGMPNAKYGHHLVPLNGFLYAVGGYFTKTVDRYDPKTDTWTSLEDTMFQHQCPGVTTYGGKIYVHGVEGFEVYTPDKDTWAGPKPAHTHFASSLVTVGNKIWAIGGNKSGEGSQASVFQYDPATQRWCTLRELETPRQGHVSFVIDC